MNSSESPGRTKPIIRPVSAKMIAQTPSTAKLPSALIQSVAEIGLKARKWAREEVTGLRLPCHYYSVWQLAGSKRSRPGGTGTRATL